MDDAAERRKKLVLVSVASVIGLALIWFGAVRPLQASIAELRTQTADVRNKISAAHRAIRSAKNFQSDLEAARDQLASAEGGIAKGDVYRWVVATLTDFKSRNVDLNDFDPPQIIDLPVPPPLPYKGAVLNVTGLAAYRDFGKFLAGFERHFPFIRLQSLSLEPANIAQASPDKPGKLGFRFQMLLLVKTNALPQK